MAWDKLTQRQTASSFYSSHEPQIIKSEMHRQKTEKSGDGCQVVLDLWRRKPSKTILVANSNLNVVLCHLSLKALLQGQDSCMDGIFQLKAFIVPEKVKMTLSNKE